MSLRSLTLSVLTAASLLLSGCGVDQEAAEYCRLMQTCECDADGACCLKEGIACYEGQCCAGLVCGASGTCVPAAQ